MSDNSHRARYPLVAIVLVVAFLVASVPIAHAQGGPALVSRFAAGSNFNSSFNGSHSGWSKTDGLSPWIQDASHYSTVGILGNFSSIRHSGTYSNFVYQAKIRRVGSLSHAQGLWVRGDPTPNVGNVWNAGYAFFYNGSGDYRVIKLTGGVVSFISPLLTSPYIVPGPSWNVLKVVFYGPAYLFYMNGVLLWAGIDPTYSSGAVGIGMEDGGAGQKLVVDWAKLTKIVGDPGPWPTLAPGAVIAPVDGTFSFGSP